MGLSEMTQNYHYGMKLPEDAQKSAVRGSNVGKEYLGDGEYICPIDHDFVADRKHEVAGHVLSKHNISLFGTDGLKLIGNYAEKYREPEQEEEEKEENSGFFTRLLSD